MPVVILEPQPNQPIEDYVEHDLPLLVKKKPKTLSWDSHNCIIVGGNPQYRINEDGLNERYRFKAKLQKLGYDVLTETNVTWTRNHFLAFDKFLVGEKENTILADGGIYIFGKDFVLASLTRETNKDVYKRAVRKFWESFGIEKLYFIPVAKKTPLRWNELGATYEDPDLDWTIGSVPWLDIYTVDTDHYREQREIFRQVEIDNNIKFIRLPSTTIRIPTFTIQGPEYKKRDLWVNGYFALPEPHGNNRTTHLFHDHLTPIVESVRHTQNGYLHNGQLEIHEVSVYQNLLAGNGYLGGTLHCLTNTAPNRQTYQEFRTRMGWNKT